MILEETKMKTAMVFPDRVSEKAIAGYSLTLTENIRKTGFKINNFTYTAGSPKTFFTKFSELKRYDVIHIQHEYNLLGGFGFPFFVLYFLLSFCKCRVVTTMHTILSLKEKFEENKLKTILRKSLYFFQNRFIKWFSDYIIVHSDFFKEILVKEYNFNPNKIKVFPQGVIETATITPRSKAKKELKLSGPVFLIMGNLTEDSGADIFLKYADKVNGTIVVVANPKPVNTRNPLRVANYLKLLKRIVKEKKFEKFVRFDLFDINDQNPLWWKYLSAADFLILAYRGGIGSGMFAHAMASQTPVISSNGPFFKDVAKKYSCLRIAEREKDYPSIIKESMNKKDYAKMLEGCKKYIKENGLTPTAEKYKRLYLELKTNNQ